MPMCCTSIIWPPCRCLQEELEENTQSKEEGFHSWFLPSFPRPLLYSTFPLSSSLVWGLGQVSEAGGLGNTVWLSVPFLVWPHTDHTDWYLVFMGLPLASFHHGLNNWHVKEWSIYYLWKIVKEGTMLRIYSVWQPHPSSLLMPTSPLLRGHGGGSPSI